MTVEKKININNTEYMIGIDLYYKNKKVFKKSKFNSYFDFGDLSYLIKNIEEGYAGYIYDNDIYFMNDIIFIYDNIPFISYVKQIDNSGSIIINVKEIEKYIVDNKIKLNRYYLNSKTPLFFN